MITPNFLDKSALEDSSFFKIFEGNPLKSKIINNNIIKKWKEEHKLKDHDALANKMIEIFANSYALDSHGDEIKFLLDTAEKRASRTKISKSRAIKQIISETRRAALGKIQFDAFLARALKDEDLKKTVQKTIIIKRDLLNQTVLSKKNFKANHWDFSKHQLVKGKNNEVSPAIQKRRAEHDLEIKILQSFINLFFLKKDRKKVKDYLMTTFLHQSRCNEKFYIFNKKHSIHSRIYKFFTDLSNSLESPRQPSNPFNTFSHFRVG